MGWFSDYDDPSTDLEALPIDDPGARRPVLVEHQPEAPPPLLGPWIADGPTARPAWPDCCVRRLVPVTLPRARAAIDAARGSGSSRLALGRGLVAHGELRVCAGLHIGRCRRRVRVELVLAPWTDAVTEMRIELRAHRGRLCISDGYFDAAHAAIDGLREWVVAHAAQPRSHLRAVA